MRFKALVSNLRMMLMGDDVWLLRNSPRSRINFPLRLLSFAPSALGISNPRLDRIRGYTGGIRADWLRKRGRGRAIALNPHRTCSGRTSAGCARKVPQSRHPLFASPRRATGRTRKGRCLMKILNPCVGTRLLYVVGGPISNKLTLEISVEKC